MLDILSLSNKTLVFERNQFVKLKGSVDTNIYYVESGSLKLYILDDDDEQIIRFGYKGNILVALDSYLGGRASDFFIQAIKKTTVRVITKEQMSAFVNAGEQNRRLWTEMMENLVLQQLEREVDLLTNSPKERYLRVLKRSPQLFQEIPNRYIANYLRMSPETLSRLKGK